MSGTDLARYPNLWKRGNRYYLRMRVPADLASVERREHIAISLQTSDFQDAVRRYRDVQGELEQRFTALRQRLAEREAVAAALSDGQLERLTESELERVAREWFDARAHLREPNVAQVDVGEALDLLEQDRDRLDVTDPAVSDDVRQATDQLLVRAGYPARGRRIAGRELGVKVPEVDRSGAQYRFLAGLVRRALEAEMALKRERLTGRAVGPVDELFDPDRPITSRPVQERRTVAGLIAAYRADREAEYGERDTSKDYGHIFRALEQLLGADKLVSEISRDDCRLLRDTLSKLPANATKKYAKLSLTEAITAGEADGAKRLSSTTLGTYMANLRAVLNWARREGWIDTSPVEGLVKKGKRSVKREGFTAEQLAVIFSSLADFRAEEPAKFWVPSLALFTGARLSELLQLYVSDVVKVEKVWCLNLSEFDAHGRRADDKRVKTSESERIVPLHPQLVDAGFLTFVEERRRGGHRRLFEPQNPDAKEDFAHAYSKWFGRFMDRVGLAAPNLVFHGFRHGFRNACRSAYIAQETAEALGGWASPNQSARYGDRGMVPVLNRAVKKVKFGSFRLDDFVSE
jgi:integrase